MGRRTAEEIAIPEELRMLNAASLAKALDVSEDAVRDLWDRRKLPFVTVIEGKERVKRCTSLADLRAFIERRRTAALAA